MVSALGYIRVNEKGLNSLAFISQMAYVRAHSIAHGYDLVGVLEDRCSASDLSRLGLNTLMQACERGTIDCILVANRARLHRDQKDWDRFVCWAFKFNIRVVVINELTPKEGVARSHAKLALVQNSAS